MYAGLSRSAVTPFKPKVAQVTTPDASVTAWTVAAHALFTVTGLVKCRLIGDVSETLTEGTGDETIEAGIAGDTACLIAQLAAPLTLAAGDIWGNPTTSTAIKSVVPSEWVFIADTDIDLVVAGTTGINDGTVTFYLEWEPISPGASVVAATWD